jgi:putative transposase
MDFKGHFALGDGSRCYPLTITDAASRYLIKCESVAKPDEAHCRPHIERAFREFGLPGRIRSDNGPPFASKALGGLSQLSVWWLQLGVEPERIEPGKPQQNGRHERFHLTLKQRTASPPKANALAQQLAFDSFRHEYNDLRPHEALSQTPPARHYEPPCARCRSRRHPTTTPT